MESFGRLSISPKYQSIRISDSSFTKVATTVPLGLVSTHDSYLWLPFCNEIQLLNSIEYFWFWYLYIYYILALPEEDPIIAGVEPQYLIGEQINLNCTSGKSYPASILHWYINEQQVSFYGLWSCFNDDIRFLFVILFWNNEPMKNMFFIKKPDARKMKRVLNEKKKIENRICSYLGFLN